MQKYQIDTILYCFDIIKQLEYILVKYREYYEETEQKYLRLYP